MTNKEIVQALRCSATKEEQKSCDMCQRSKRGCFECINSYLYEAASLIEQMTDENAALREKVPQWIEEVSAERCGGRTMERLTEWNGGQTRHAYYPRCFKEPCYGSGCKIKDCPFETAVCERLAAYEDIAELCGGADRLRELAEADKDGRCVVLPCKVGDTVWRIKRTFETYPDKSEPYIEPDAFLLQDVFNIGKTVFLTREEADHELKRVKGW